MSAEQKDQRASKSSQLLAVDSLLRSNIIERAHNTILRNFRLAEPPTVITIEEKEVGEDERSTKRQTATLDAKGLSKSHNIQMYLKVLQHEKDQLSETNKYLLEENVKLGQDSEVLAARVKKLEENMESKAAHYRVLINRVREKNYKLASELELLKSELKKKRDRTLELWDVEDDKKKSRVNDEEYDEEYE
jgi:hypothetical protein